MMMKRLLAGILAGATVLGLAACGSTAKQPETQPETLAAAVNTTPASGTTTQIEAQAPSSRLLPTTWAPWMTPTICRPCPA